MAQKRKAQPKKKRGWRFYVGIFCALDAVVMLTTNLFASVVYAAIAFFLLRNKKTAEPSQVKQPVTEPIPKPEPASEPDSESKPAPVPAAPKKDPPPKPDFTNKTYRVTGIQHYMDNLLSLAVPNPDYNMTKREIIDLGMTDEYIWEYAFYPSKLELQPEPDHPKDPNAIKVLIDDKHVGYIKEGSCKHLLNVMEQDRFLGAACQIGGGNYKRVDEDYDLDTDKTTYDLDKGDRNYSIVLTVKEKKVK